MNIYGLFHNVYNGDGIVTDPLCVSPEKINLELRYDEIVNTVGNGIPKVRKEPLFDLTGWDQERYTQHFPFSSFTIEYVELI